MIKKRTIYLLITLKVLFAAFVIGLTYYLFNIEMVEFFALGLIGSAYAITNIFINPII